MAFYLGNVGVNRSREMRSVWHLTRLFVAIITIGYAQNAHAESKFTQTIEVMPGQGISGEIEIFLTIKESGSWNINITSMKLRYESSAQYNNIDDKYSGMPMKGFQSVLRTRQSDAEPIDVQLIPITGAFDAAGRFSCMNCGSFVLSRANLDRSDVWLSSVVAGGLIFFNSLQINAPFRR